MIDAHMAGYHIQFIDVANCFNPHILASFNHDLILDDILMNITLGRPFQYYQSVSILDALIMNLIKTRVSDSLIIISALDNQLMELEQKDQQERDFTHTLGGLQNIAANGNAIVVSNQIRDKCRRICSAYASAHVRIEAG